MMMIKTPNDKVATKTKKINDILFNTENEKLGFVVTLKQSVNFIKICLFSISKGVATTIVNI